MERAFVSQSSNPSSSPHQQQKQQHQPYCYCRVHGVVAQQAPDGNFYPVSNSVSASDARKAAALMALQQQRQQQRLQEQQYHHQPHYHWQPHVGHIGQHHQYPLYHHNNLPQHQIVQRQSQGSQQVLVACRKPSQHHPGHHHHHPQPQPSSHQSHGHKLQHPEFYFKSAPASPVASNRYATNPAVLAAVARAHKAKRQQHASGSPSHSPSVNKGVSPGCCGGLNLSNRVDTASTTSSSGSTSSESVIRRGRSSSYSALDTVSLESNGTTDENSSEDAPLFQQTPQKVSECAKNLVRWVSNVGDRVGKGTTALLDHLPSIKEDHHVVMVGLDSAGKTTVLYRLKFDQYVNTVPTIGFNCEKVRGSIGRTRALTFLVWDVGGQEKLRPLWRSYTRCTDGIIFVVDSTDPSERLEEAKLELHKIMRMNVHVPLLVIANKQDLPAARNPADLEKILALSDLRQNLWHLEAVCAVTGEGLDLAIERLHELIVKRKKMSKRARNKTR